MTTIENNHAEHLADMIKTLNRALRVSEAKLFLLAAQVKQQDETIRELMGIP